jgi:hypothetical protein
MKAMTAAPARAHDFETTTGLPAWSFFADADRYQFDFGLCSAASGWQQYDTDQDAWYFGIWVNVKLRLIVSYVEGDITVVDCLNETGLTRELATMADFYGEPPPAFVTIDADGSVTHYMQERPAA